MDSLGKICILGGGTWGTAMAKIVLMNQKSINWFIRRDDQIEGFYKLGYNPNYLSNVKFNLSQITFYSNIEKAIKDSDTIILAIPSPYVKQYMKWIWNSTFKGKFVVSALKGIIPGDNAVVTEYLAYNFKIPIENLGVISGPCHAEEVALERLSFLTVASKDVNKAQLLSEAITSKFMKSSVSTDVVGIELAAVLKNIYAIAAGICQGLRYGDNFQAVLMSKCATEMECFLAGVVPMQRNICELHYLGDMLVTGYSQFSRNRTLGAMLGKGYSVKTAQLEMEMIAEGYYGAKCIDEMNKHFKIDIPIAETVYKILYEKVRPQVAIKKLIEEF
ncbi:MAG: NAD(P)H-dependent glycerol-3-phosphate dehydrogenase [Dysgonamonadaceae bacterium]|jgi:glycerol-3-phosphate dehydrogenase (NAD(P)+)|nr:NAD(P)H-dependent glycerol-3-phosphate dehydrogenase [Dysgonamonadaceae bacterium]